MRERWTLERRRDVLSPAPENAKAEHCPRCGAPLQTRTDGACLHCGTLVRDGSFHWFVTGIRGMDRSHRPPRLGGGSGVGPGLDRPTIYQPHLTTKLQQFGDLTPFETRVRQVATELQHAWTSRDWQRARPYETDALFQTHRYWIEEYLRQNARNHVDEYTIDRIDVAKIASDPFYDAITVRLFASGRDYTIDVAGNLIGGSREYRRSWSEYWTFIRGRAPGSASARICPNCGGALSEGQTAICGYCGGKVTTGEFPWVLSRIEQDEAYRG